MLNITCKIISIMFIFGCSSQKQNEQPILTNDEKRICDSLKIDTMIVRLIKKYSVSTIEPFHYSLGKLYENGIEKELDPIYLNGIIFKATEANTKSILDNYYTLYKNRGYSLFILEQNFALKERPDIMAILPVTDKYEILKKIKTDAINYDIDNDSLIKLIHVFDEKYTLDLTGAGGDWCQFTINKCPDDWMTIAKEAYGICPDIVGQGTGTIESLAEEMKRTKLLYFWWD